MVKNLFIIGWTTLWWILALISFSQVHTLAIPFLFLIGQGIALYCWGTRRQEDVPVGGFFMVLLIFIVILSMVFSERVCFTAESQKGPLIMCKQVYGYGIIKHIDTLNQALMQRQEAAMLRMVE